ncbi:MAG: hypothetical protein HY280_09640 [Nitrospinae bacterium]|nr:hypothetical protein [Nitrospinota bacterium]
MGIALFPPSSKGGEHLLKNHWNRPAVAGNVGGSLLPSDCGFCHTAQHALWKDSLHARAVGPGLLGQLDVERDFATALSCFKCHAPLLEQQEAVVKGDETVKNSLFNPDLKKAGVTCAVCHVRGGKVYGPRQYGGLKTADGKGKRHFSVESADFHKSEFCAACHQLADGYKLNGKLLVNTYKEWRGSDWAKKGLQCQDCHMPDRAHLFKGIHDKEMTLRAVELNITQKKGAITLSVANVGAGHYFPTYATPLVVIKAYSVDASGAVISGSVREDFIGRKVSLDLEREEFDTRIPPGGRHEYVYKKPPDGTARVVFEISVYPDKFYFNLFKSLTDNDGAADPGLIKEATVKAESSPYLLWKGEAKPN